MSQGSRFAIALVLFVLAGIALFVAFHPGGLNNPDGTPVSNLGQVTAWWITYLGDLSKLGSKSGPPPSSGNSPG